MNSISTDTPPPNTIAPLWRRVAKNPLWDIMAVVVALATLPRYATLMPQAARASDFSHYYLTCRALLEGHSPYTTSLAPMAEKYGLVLSPDNTFGGISPGLQWLFAPFAILDPGSAFWLWSLLQALSLAVMLWCTRRLLAGRLSARAWRFLVCGAVASVPMLIHFTESQAQLLIGALLLLALVWQCAGRPVAACLAVVAAGLLKLFPFALLPWFVWRGGRTWRERAILAGVSLTAIGVTVIASGPALWGDFLQHGLRVVDYWSRNFMFNYCLASLVKHSGGTWSAGLVVGFVSLAMAYALCLRLREDREAQFCLVSLAMLAGGTTTWSHYMVLTIFPVAVVAARVAANPSSAWVLVFAVTVMALDNVDASTSAFPAGWRLAKLLWIYTPLFGQLALATLLLNLSHLRRDALSPRRSGSSP